MVRGDVLLEDNGSAFDVDAWLSRVYCSPFYMTDTDVRVKFFLMSDDDGSVDKHIANGRHNMIMGGWDVMVRKPCKRLLSGLKGSDRKRFYSRLHTMLHSVVQDMKSSSDLYMDPNYVKTTHPDGEEYMMPVMIHGHRELRRVMNQNGSILILANGDEKVHEE